VNSNVAEGNTASIFRLLRRPKYEYTDYLENQMLREIYDGTEQKLRRGWGTGPYLRTGPVPGRQIFRGGILKKSRLKYGMREKKGCPRERNLREICTENNVGTEFSRYDATGARRS